jgi:NADPH:quinone reductase-like Zn-dependent oxidoreductase
MRIMVVKRYGPPENLELREAPDPQLKSGEVLIRTKAIGVNFADLLQRMGLYPGTPKPPFVPGLELAGVVEKIADGGKSSDGEPLRIGDAVVAYTHFNAYAEWVAVPAGQIYRMPAGMPFEDAAALLVNYLTAYHSMFAMGNLQSGDRILIHGAAGGVGIAAVQLARLRGLEVYGTAGPAKQEFLRKIGVDHAIDYQKTDCVDVVKKFAPAGIEMVMDAIGGSSFSRSAECLGPTGRLVVYGLSAATGDSHKRNWISGAVAVARTPRFHPLKLMSKNIAIIGVSLGGVWESHHGAAMLRGELTELLKLYSAGSIKPVIAKSFPFLEAAAAHTFIHERKNIGKVLLTIR